MSISNEHIQQALADEILKSIKTHGLLPRTSRTEKGVFSVNSADGNDGHFCVCMSEITLTSAISAEERQRRFTLMSEKQDFGMRSVSLERTYNLSSRNFEAPDLKAELEDRLKNSIVLIMKPQAFKIPEEGIRSNVFGNPMMKHGTIATSLMDGMMQAMTSSTDKKELSELRKRWESTQGTKPDFEECRIQKIVDFNNVLAILVPEHLCDSVRSAYPSGIPIYSVPNTSNPVSMAVPTLECLKYYPKSFNIYNQTEINYTLLGPDYVKGLEQFYQAHSNKGNAHFACHLVKLPTLKGVEHGLKAQLPHFIKMKEKLERDAKEAEERKIALERAQKANAALVIQKYYKKHQKQKSYQEFMVTYRQKRAETTALIAGNNLDAGVAAATELKNMRDAFLMK